MPLRERPLYRDTRDKRVAGSCNFDKQLLRDNTTLKRGLYVVTDKGTHLREELMSDEELKKH